jgi:hypothetical protein
VEQERPTHDDVLAAVAAAGDAELASWVSDPDGYVLVPVQLPRAAQHDFFALTPLGGAHPVGVLLARPVGGGSPVVTSGSAHAVWQVLRADPELAEPDLVVHLLAPSWDTTEYVGPGSTPPVVAQDGGWRCDVRVRELADGPVERWLVTLSETPSWQVER